MSSTITKLKDKARAFVDKHIHKGPGPGAVAPVTGAAPTTGPTGATGPTVATTTPWVPATPLTLTTRAACSTLPVTRTRLGVGETVRVTASRGPVAWTVNGAAQGPTGVSINVVMRAGAGTIQVVATVGTASASVTFTVVEPNGLTIDQVGGKRHGAGTASAGFYGQPWVTPADVSFHGIQIREKNSSSTASGAFATWNAITHQPATQTASGWFTVDECTAGKGSKVGCTDNIYSGELTGPPPFAAGQLVFPCEWEYKAPGTGATVFVNLTHLQTIDAPGKVTVSKGGTTVDADFG